MFPNQIPNGGPSNYQLLNAGTQFVRPAILVEPVLMPRPILLVPIVFRSPYTPIYRFNGYIPMPTIQATTPIPYYRTSTDLPTIPSASVRQQLNVANMAAIHMRNTQNMPQPANTDTFRFAAPLTTGVYSNVVVPVVPVVPPVLNNGIGLIENNQQVPLQQAPVTTSPVLMDMNSSILHNVGQIYAAPTTLEVVPGTPQQANLAANINNPYVMESDNIGTVFTDGVSNTDSPEMGVSVFTGLFNIPQAIVRESSLSVPTLNLVEGLPTLTSDETVLQPTAELNDDNAEQLVEGSVLTTMSSNLDPNIHVDIDHSYVDMLIEPNAEVDDGMPGFSGGSAGNLDGMVMANTEVSNINFKMVLDEQLFELFYNSEIVDQEFGVAAELFTRNWRFHGPSCIWFRRDPKSRDFKINGSIVRGGYEIYNTVTACVDLVYTEVDESEFDQQPEPTEHGERFTENGDET